MITVKSKGNFSKLADYISKSQKATEMSLLDRYGREGVAALSSVTPVDTGETAKSWYYKIERKKGLIRLLFCNSNIRDGVPIAIILQYGHATRNGGWVEGQDYINPETRRVFDKIAADLWKEVTQH